MVWSVAKFYKNEFRVDFASESGFNFDGLNFCQSLLRKAQKIKVFKGN
jgi:hypothetical protein